MFNFSGRGVQIGATYSIQVTGDRVVIGFGSLVIAAVNADNLTRV